MLSPLFHFFTRQVHDILRKDLVQRDIIEFFAPKLSNLRVFMTLLVSCYLN